MKEEVKEDKEHQKNSERPSVVAAPIARLPFPTDYSQLEQLMRRENHDWKRNRPPHQWRLTHLINSALDNSQVRRKSSYVLIFTMMIIAIWILYEKMGGNTYFRNKYFPGL